MDDSPFDCPNRDARAVGTFCSHKSSLVYLSVMVLPAFAASRYLHTLIR